LIQGPVIDIDNRFNEVFPAFNPLNPEFTPGCRVIDSFFSHFSFHSFNRPNKKSLFSHSHQLDSLALSSSENPSHALVITDTSVKNNVATSITYVHIYNKPVVKTLHHVVNINSTEAELFTIRCDINQATTSSEISKNFVITHSIHAAKKIFDPTSHPFQIHTAKFLCILS